MPFIEPTRIEHWRQCRTWCQVTDSTVTSDILCSDHLSCSTGPYCWVKLTHQHFQGWLWLTDSPTQGNPKHQQSESIRPTRHAAPFGKITLRNCFLLESLVWVPLVRRLHEILTRLTEAVNGVRPASIPSRFQPEGRPSCLQNELSLGDKHASH